MPSGRKKSIQPTMQSIADSLGISKVSVHKALTGKKGISDALRQKILATAEELHYAQAEPHTEKRYAFIVAKRFFLDSDTFYTKMFYHFNRLCAANGDSAQLMIVGSHDEYDRVLPAQLNKSEFCGIAVAGELSEPYLRGLVALGLPTVFMDFDNYNLGCRSIMTDNFYWGYRAAKYLIDRGHTELGFVGEYGSTDSITDRYLGFRKALLSNGLKLDESWHLINNDSESKIYTSSIKLPERLPTAFVCHCDMAAHYLIASLSAAGCSCPDDISVISFDDTRLAEINVPPLTSIRIDTREFASQALGYLDQMTREGSQLAGRVYISSEIVERGSVKTL